MTTIDAVAAGRPVTMIKMDVEGAEVQAIAGGRQTIGECKPKLFVADSIMMLIYSVCRCFCGSWCRSIRFICVSILMSLHGN